MSSECAAQPVSPAPIDAIQHTRQRVVLMGAELLLTPGLRGDEPVEAAAQALAQHLDT